MMYDNLAAIISLRPGAEFMIKNGDVTWFDQNQSEPTSEEIQAEIDRLTEAEPLRQLRETRDKLLAETDWWATSDRTMTAEETAYRQALRDLPANTPDPANPVWPTKP
jgi:predicted ATPase